MFRKKRLSDLEEYAPSQRSRSDDTSRRLPKVWISQIASPFWPHHDLLPVFSAIGFHRTALLDQSATLVDAVKADKIRRFFVIGGCDGSEPGRNYFTEYAANTPDDTFVLTLGCGKYRIFEHEYGTLLGFPRLLDMGQCNDACGAIQVARTLANAFDCSVNDLPLTLVVSWFEQKAVAVLLSLLSLGVRRINIGSRPPAFLTPDVFNIIQERFDLKLTGVDARSDLEAVLA